MTILPQDLRSALRTLVKHPGYAAVAVLTLAVGVGANTAIFSVLHAVVLRDLPYHDADRLAVLSSVSLQQNLPDGSSYLNAKDWKEQSRAFRDMAVYHRTEFTRATITGGPTAERVHVGLVGAGFFQLLGTSPLLGRTFEAADFEARRQAIVISYGLWRQRFGGDVRAIGRSLEVDRTACEIVGVMPPEFKLPTPEIQVWRPISVMPNWPRLQSDPRSRGGDSLMVIGRLAPSASFESARAEMTTIAARLREAYPDDNAGRGVMVERLTDRVIGARTMRALWLLFAAVGFVLLIACANVSNLALARGTARHNELSLRTALGASRWRLIRQALTESLVLALAGAAAGIGVAWLSIAALRTWASAAMPRMDTLQIDRPVFLFALAAAMLCGLLAGLLPAWLLSMASPAEALREGGPRSRGGRGTSRLRHGLVVAEIALAVVLLSGGGLLIRSFARVQGADRGFDSGNVLLLQIDPTNRFGDSAAYYRAALERIRSVPGVVAAGVITDFFIERQADSTLTVEGRPPRLPGEVAPPLIRDRAGPGYLEAMRTPLLRGRFFQESDLAPTAGRSGIINDTMARVFWPGEDPVGKRLKWGGDRDWITVVGVVADMRRQKLDEPAIPSMFEPGFSRQMDIAVRTTGDPAALRDAIAAELRALDPAAPPYGIATVEQRLAQTVAVRQLQMFLLAALAAAALVLATVGVYGLIHHSVASRTPEIGVRMALGATRGSVLWMTLSGALGLAGAGLVLGLLASLALGRTLSSFLYETSPLDPLIHAGVAALLLSVTTLASLVPARRASRVDPMTALRHD